MTDSRVSAEERKFLWQAVEKIRTPGAPPFTSYQLEQFVLTAHRMFEAAEALAAENASKVSLERDRRLQAEARAEKAEAELHSAVRAALLSRAESYVAERDALRDEVVRLREAATTLLSHAALNMKTSIVHVGWEWVAPLSELISSAAPQDCNASD